jgi:hypothetical protein
LLTRGLALNAVEVERVWSGFWTLAAENLRAGRGWLNGPELSAATTLHELERTRESLAPFAIPRRFDEAYPKLLLTEARGQGEASSYEDIVARLREPYAKDGLDGATRTLTRGAPAEARQAVARRGRHAGPAAPTHAGPAPTTRAAAGASRAAPAIVPSRAAPSVAGHYRLEPLGVQVHGVDLALECDRGRITRGDLDGLVRAVGRFPPEWLRAVATSAAQSGRALPRIVLCDSPTFAAVRRFGADDTGWYDAAENRVVVDIERIHGGPGPSHADGRRFDADEWLEHTIIHELAHAFDHLGGDGPDDRATDQGEPRHGGGAFVRAVRDRNASLDPADYVSDHDRRRNMALDNAVAEPQELFAEIVHVLVTEGATGRERLRARPHLAPLVDAVERYFSHGLRPELLGSYQAV